MVTQRRIFLLAGVVSVLAAIWLFWPLNKEPIAFQGTWEVVVQCGSWQLPSRVSFTANGRITDANTGVPLGQYHSTAINSLYIGPILQSQEYPIYWLPNGFAVGDDVHRYQFCRGENCITGRCSKG